jgi:hypothetical protein
MKNSVKDPDLRRQHIEQDAGIAIASVWLALYLAMLVIVLTDHSPSAVIDVAAAHN